MPLSKVQGGVPVVKGTATNNNGQSEGVGIPALALVNPGTGDTLLPLGGADLRSGTGTVTAVASQTGAITILAANAVRKGATIYNSDANALTLLLSDAGEVSGTNLSTIIAAGGYYEVPFGYAGRIRGLWAADGTGSAFVTEFS